MVTRPSVDVLGPDDVADVVSVIGEAFFDYPVMRFVLGAERDYRERLDTLLHFFVRARLLRNEFLFGVREPAGGLRAAALVSLPGRRSSPPEMDELRERTWSEIGGEARARYETVGAVTGQFGVGSTHIHLNMIGVRRAAQGQGLGRAILDAVHGLSAADPESSGVTLTTEVESNLPLYRHVGYEVVGSAPVASAFTTWFMYRRDPVDSALQPGQDSTHRPPARG